MAEHVKFHYKTVEEIRADIESLGLGIQLSDDLSVLCAPVTIGHHVSPNAMVIHPMEGRDGHPDGKPSDLTYRRYNRYARGGAGLIWFEASAIWAKGRSTDRQLLFTESNLMAWSKLLEFTRKAAMDEFGRKPVCVIQLKDAGRYRHATGTTPALVVRNPVLDPRAHIPEDHPLMSDFDIEEFEERLAGAAIDAYRIGFDGADIKLCHRYLGSDMLSAFTREGKYGGTFEGRTRFVLNVVDRIKAEVPKEFLITTRMNIYDGIPYPYGWGVDKEDVSIPDLTEPIRLAGLLRERGVKLINTSGGTPYYNSHVTRPYDNPVIGVNPPKEHPLEGVDRAFRLVGEFTKANPGAVIVGTSYTWLRQFWPMAAAANIAAGKAHMVGLGRTAFAYPDFARDIFEKGKLDPAKVCISCSLCSQIMRDGYSTGCVVRDKEVYGPIYKEDMARRNG